MKSSTTLSPICLFTYNRLNETSQTVEALKKNFLAKNSELIIFSDGPKDGKSKENVDAVRKYIKSITGFKSIQIFESKINKGLANSIIEGVTETLKKYKKVIVLEDDLLTTPNFLNFMNEALDFYENNKKIFSISGYSMNLPSLSNHKYDYYFGVRASSWGWATWRRSWIDIDWDIKDYSNFINSNKLKREFSKGGIDMPKMLSNQMNQKIDSWAIRWCYNQFQRKQFTVFPRISKLVSIGFGANATHTKGVKRFDTILDEGNQINFNFAENVYLDEKLVKEFKHKFSFFARIIDKLF